MYWYFLLSLSKGSEYFLRCGFADEPRSRQAVTQKGYFLQSGFVSAKKKKKGSIIPLKHPAKSCRRILSQNLYRPLDQTPVTASLLLACCPFDVFKQFIFSYHIKADACGYQTRKVHTLSRGGPLTPPRCVPYSILSLLVFD